MNSIESSYNVFLKETIINTSASLIVLILIIAQAISFKYEQKSRNYVVILLTVSILFANLGSLSLQLMMLNAWPKCSNCSIMYTLNRLLFVTIRCLNRLFFISRAKKIKLFQQYTTKQKTSIDRCYDKILPSLIVAIYLILIAGITTMQTIEAVNNHDFNQTECVSVSSTHHTCVHYANFTTTNLQDNAYIFGTMVAVISNIIILYLFIKPLCGISDMTLNYNDVEGRVQEIEIRKKYKRILTINIGLLMVNMLSSQFIVSVWSLLPQYLWFAPPIDSIINALTIFLMIGNNRHWTAKMCFYVIECCCCCMSDKCMMKPSNTPCTAPTLKVNHSINYSETSKLELDYHQQISNERYLGIGKHYKLSLQSIDEEISEDGGIVRRPSSFDETIATDHDMSKLCSTSLTKNAEILDNNRVNVNISVINEDNGDK